MYIETEPWLRWLLSASVLSKNFPVQQLSIQVFYFCIHIYRSHSTESLFKGMDVSVFTSWQSEANRELKERLWGPWQEPAWLTVLSPGSTSSWARQNQTVSSPTTPDQWIYTSYPSPTAFQAVDVFLSRFTCPQYRNNVTIAYTCSQNDLGFCRLHTLPHIYPTLLAHLLYKRHP